MLAGFLGRFLPNVHLHRLCGGYPHGCRRSLFVMVSWVLPNALRVRVGEARFFGSFVDLQKG